MKRIKNRMKWILFTGLFFCLTNISCDSDHGTEPEQIPDDKSVISQESDRSLLILTADELSNDDNLIHITVDYVLGTDASGPRVVELKLAHSPNLQFVSAEPGSSILSAQKEMVARQKESGVVRLVIYGTSNLNTLDTGTLAKLAFEKTDQQSATLEIMTRDPIFAPEEANKGLLVSDPVTL